MLEAWQSDRFKTYPRLPGWNGPRWSLLLVPGWRSLEQRPLAEIVARQWAITTDILLDDLEALPGEQVRAIDYAALLATPQPVVADLAASLGLGWDRALGASLPLSKTTMSRPGKDKWRRLEAEIQAVMPIFAEADARARAFLERFRAAP